MHGGCIWGPHMAYHVLSFHRGSIFLITDITLSGTWPRGAEVWTAERDPLSEMLTLGSWGLIYLGRALERGQGKFQEGNVHKGREGVLGRDYSLCQGPGV